MRTVFVTIASIGLSAAVGGGALAQTDKPSDPGLQASWDFMRQEMPGAPLSLLEAACKEGRVMIYHGTWVDAQDAQMKRFHERFPCVAVDKFSADTGQRQERWLSEVHAGRNTADVIQDTDPGFLDAQAAAGNLKEYKIANDDAFEPAAKRSGYWYALRVALVGIAWNTDLVTDEEAAKLRTWDGVIDPTWTGRAEVVDPSAGGVAYLPWYIWLQRFGIGFFDKIAALKPRIAAAVVPAGASLAAGDVAVLLNASETGLLPLFDRGAPIRWSLPEPGIGPMTGQAIAANAPHPAAAELYQEYSFTQEGYGIWQKLGGAPARRGVKDQRPVAKESWYKVPATFAEYDRADASSKTPEVMGLFRSHIAKSQ